jgi:tetratricopeptide (TPR) repeat protein
MPTRTIRWWSRRPECDTGHLFFWMGSRTGRPGLRQVGGISCRDPVCWSTMRCGQCHGHVRGVSRVPCPRCPVRYCSQACQVAAAADHRRTCYTEEERSLQRTLLRSTTIKDCHVCHKTSDQTVDDCLRVCGRCRGVRYCGRVCQASEWSDHRRRCRRRSSTARRPLRHTVVANPAQDCLRHEGVQVMRCRALGHEVAEALASWRCAIVYRRLGYLRAAVVHAARSEWLLSVATHVSSVLHVHVYEELGRAMVELGAYTEATAVYHVALEHAALRLDPVARGRLYGALGMVAEAQDDWGQASRWYTQCVEVLSTTQDPVVEASAQAYRARLALHAHDYTQVLDCLGVYVRGSHDQDVAYEECGVASELCARVALAQHDYPTALAAYHEQRRIAVLLGYRLAESRAYGRLGRVYQAQGDHVPQAVRFFQHQLVIAQALYDVRGKIEAYQGLLELTDDPTCALHREYTSELRVCRQQARWMQDQTVDQLLEGKDGVYGP